MKMIIFIISMLMIMMIGGILFLKSNEQTHTERDIDWPQFMHDAYHTNFSLSNGPNRPEILWVHDIGWNIQATPIISNDLILIMPDFDLGVPAPPTTPQPKLYALDIYTNWNVWTHKKEGFRNFDSAAVDDNSVFISDYQESSSKSIRILKSLDLKTGKTKWQIEMVVKGPTTPSVADGKIFLPAAPLTCINQEDGSKLWDVYESNNTEEYGWSFFPPMIAENKIFMVEDVSDKSILYCFDKNDGKELWRFEKSSLSLPIYFRGEVIISSNDKLSALNPDNGEVIWEWNNGDITGHIGAIAFENAIMAYSEKRIISSDLGKEEIVYKSKIYSLDLNTKKIVWVSDTIDLGFSYHIIATKNCIYAVQIFGKIYALNTENGELQWMYQIDGGNQEISAPPVIANGILFVGAGTKLYAFSTDPDAFSKQGDEFLRIREYQKSLDSYKKSADLYEKANNNEGKIKIEEKMRKIKMLIMFEKIKETKNGIIFIGIVLTVAVLYIIYKKFKSKY